MSKAMDLALKLKALADRGVGGEATNAQQLLEQHCAKYNIAIEDLEEDKVETFTFKLNANYRKLFIQVASTVVGQNIKCNTYRGDAKNYWIKCTQVEWIEIKAKFDFHLLHYQNELKVFFQAYLEAHNLFPQASGKIEPKKWEDLTPEEKELSYRAREMQTTIKKGKFNKQLQ